jgi:transposase
MYSLVGSAKLNGLNPELYLRTVLAQIADHPVSKIHDSVAMEPRAVSSGTHL